MNVTKWFSPKKKTETMGSIKIVKITSNYLQNSWSFQKHNIMWFCFIQWTLTLYAHNVAIDRCTQPPPNIQILFRILQCPVQISKPPSQPDPRIIPVIILIYLIKKQKKKKKKKKSIYTERNGENKRRKKIEIFIGFRLRNQQFQNYLYQKISKWYSK